MTILQKYKLFRRFKKMDLQPVLSHGASTGTFGINTTLTYEVRRPKLCITVKRIYGPQVAGDKNCYLLIVTDNQELQGAPKNFTDSGFLARGVFNMFLKRFTPWEKTK